MIDREVFRYTEVGAKMSVLLRVGFRSGVSWMVLRRRRSRGEVLDAFPRPACGKARETAEEGCSSIIHAGAAGL
jgi:hypothetical protein